MDHRDIMKIYSVLLVITNCYLASGIKCYLCLYTEGNPNYNDPSCKTLEGDVLLGRSAQSEEEKFEKAAKAMLHDESASSGRQKRKVCTTFVGTWDGKDTVLRSKVDSSQVGCKRLAAQVDLGDFGQKYVDGEYCYCETDACNNVPFGGAGKPRPPGGGAGSFAGDQKLSFIVAILQLVYITLVGNNR